jgi:hypothetical protein
LRDRLPRFLRRAGPSGAQITGAELNLLETRPRPAAEVARDVAGRLPKRQTLKDLIFQPRVLSTALALLLLIPVLGIAFQDRASLEQFHNRKLRPWPNATVLLSDPPQYFQHVRQWMSDWAFPIEEATLFQKKFLFYVLSTLPQRRVMMGKNGFIFLNGASDDTLNGILESTCVSAHTVETAATLKNALVSLASYAAQRAVAVDVVMVPTPATLYGDFLPNSVPKKYRAACRERTAGHTPLLELERSSPVNFVFPLLDMKELRLDEGFFPKGNWHPTGLSLKTIRDAYLRQLGVNATVEETLVKTKGPSELLLSYGIEWALPVYAVTKTPTVVDAAKTASLTQAIADFFPPSGVTASAFRSEKPVIDDAALMVSDSYGNLAAPVFAAAFREFQHVMTNDMHQERLAELIERVERLGHLGRIIMLVEEGNTDRIVEWSQSLRMAKSAAISPIPEGCLDYSSSAAARQNGGIFCNPSRPVRLGHR